MKRTLLSSALALALGSACTPSIEQTTPPVLITANFDVSATPPVVPTPNDLAMNRTTGLLSVPLDASASDADKEFAAYLNTLDGFPVSTSATASFNGELDPATVNGDNVIVNDITNPAAPVRVSDVAPAFSAGRLVIPPPAGGWKPGHGYAIVLLGTAGDGTHGLKGAKGETVVGSSLWALIRSRTSLVTCPLDATGNQDLTSPACKVKTSVIPTDAKEASERLADQTAKALQLEQLRLGLKPMFDGMENPPAGSCPPGTQTCSLPRSLVALAWTFHITGQQAMAFDPTSSPPSVPIPTDLAMDPATGKVNAPIDPSKSAAEQEFTRDYLNTLDGFPPLTGGAASVKNGDLDPASLTAQTVIVADMTAMDAPPAATVSYDAAKKSLVIAPPEGGWTKGHHYAIAVVGGAGGVKGVGGKTVVASDVWALARSKASLVTCEDLTSADCASALTLAPLSAGQAVQLEALRRQFEPVLDAFQALHGVARKDLAVAWTFKVLSQPEVLFNPDLDPAKAVIPFPNSLLIDNATGKVKLPVPADPESAALYLGLNTLDGFSTTAPIVSENSLTRGALDLGELDEATVVVGAVGLMNLTPSGAAPEYKVCVDCATSAQPGTAPQSLQIVPTVPLDEKTNYGAFVTTALKDRGGKQVVPATPWALARLEHPLIDAAGKSTVSVLPDDRAAALEMLRLAYKPYLDALVASGVARKDLALAWTFKTETTWSQLPLIKGIPGALGQMGALSDKPDFVVDMTTAIKAQMTAGGIPNDKVAKIFAGEYTTPQLLTGPGQTINPDPTKYAREHSPFLVVLPDTAATPANGYPVVVFSHGITRNRTDVLAIANSLAIAGYASIATDLAWHGERSTCTGAGVLAGGACIPGTALCDGVTACDQKGTPGSALCLETVGKCVASDETKRTACDDATIFGATGKHLPPNAFCQGLGLGSCMPDQKCQAADFARDARGGVKVSGWNFLNVANLFNTRDNFRQPTADLAQLYRVVSSTSIGAEIGQIGLNDMLVGLGGAAGLDKANYHFLGMSLGSITGIPYVSAAPEVKRALFNVPGANLATILQTSGELAQLRGAWLAGLATKGIVPGSPAFDQYIAIAHWILDPADPLNSVNQVLNWDKAPAGRAAFIQYVSGDFFIPNPTTEELIGSANRVASARKTWWYQFDGSAVAEGDRHGFLLNGKSALTVPAQQQAVLFLASGQKPTGAQP
ncbi:MAG TPA: hypothetical protein VGK67_04810 [Myxococcales bacterium]|jgi:hypothetical protein